MRALKVRTTNATYPTLSELQRFFGSYPGATRFATLSACPWLSYSALWRWADSSSSFEYEITTLRAPSRPRHKGSPDRFIADFTLRLPSSFHNEITLIGNSRISKETTITITQHFP